MTTNYLILEQLAASMRRVGMTTTADLAAHEAAILTERFGPLREWRVDPRTIPVWLDQYVNSLRQRAAHHERSGDLPGQLGALLAISLLAHTRDENLTLTPDDVRGLVSTAERAVSMAFERINSNRANEYGAARFSARVRVQANAHAELTAQARQQKVAQLAAVQRQLERELAE